MKYIIYDPESYGGKNRVINQKKISGQNDRAVIQSIVAKSFQKPTEKKPTQSNQEKLVAYEVTKSFIDKRPFILLFSFILFSPNFMPGWIIDYFLVIY